MSERISPTSFKDRKRVKKKVVRLGNAVQAQKSCDEFGEGEKSEPEEGTLSRSSRNPKKGKTSGAGCNHDRARPPNRGKRNEKTLSKKRCLRKGEF